MNLLTVLGEVLPVVATLLLLGLWLYQQLAVERRSHDLGKLTSARSVYLTYQSNNAIFNAIIEIAANKRSEQIREFQIYNYELGLRAMEEALPESDKRDIPAAPNAYDSSVSYDAKISQTQERLEKLQLKISQREEAIGDAARRAKVTYLWLYFGLSLVAVIGTLCKLAVQFLGTPG